MFYEGDLQSGISKAVQESKFIACFVSGQCPSHSRDLMLTGNVSSDDEEESMLWENEYLQDEAVSSQVSEQLENDGQRY